MDQAGASQVSYDGLLVADHRPAESAQIMLLKLCENCGSAFTRLRTETEPFVVKDFDVSGYNTERPKNQFSVHDGNLSLLKCYGNRELRRDRGQKYCKRCQARALAPVVLDEYKLMLPTEQEMRHSNYLPKVDESLVGNSLAAKQRAMRERQRRPKSVIGDWQPRLMAAFAERGPLTYEQMREVTRHSNRLSLKSALCYCDIPIERVGSVWPRQRSIVNLGLYHPVPGCN